MTSAYCDWSALLGFYTEPAARSILMGHGVSLSKQKEEELMAEVRQARTYVSTIEGRQGVAPRVEDIPPGHGDHLRGLQDTRVIEDVMKTGMKSWSFGLVELAKIHVHQPYINLEYAALLAEKAPDPSDLGARLGYCLPIRADPSSQGVSVTLDSSRNVYTVSSDNLGLRVAGTSQGADDQRRRFLGFTYDFGLPQMFVVDFNGLFILKNGYHRAYALLKKGHESIPCVILKADDFALTGANRPGLLPSDVILSGRSPILSDYLTAAAVTIPRRRVRAVLSVKAGVEMVQF